MNKRIKKKVAKRQMIAAIRGIVELAQEMERRGLRYNSDKLKKAL